MLKKNTALILTFLLIFQCLMIMPFTALAEDTVYLAKDFEDQATGASATRCTETIEFDEAINSYVSVVTHNQEDGKDMYYGYNVSSPITTNFVATFDLKLSSNSYLIAFMDNSKSKLQDWPKQSVSLRYDGSSKITADTQEISGISPDTWYSYEVSVDYTNKMYNVSVFDMERNLIGSVSNVKFADSTVNNINWFFLNTRVKDVKASVDNIKFITYGPSTIEISGKDKLSIASSEIAEEQYTAIIRSSSGNVLSGYQVNWSIVGSPEGISINNNGLLRIEDYVASQTIVISASVVGSPTVNTSITVEIIKELPTDEEIVRIAKEFLQLYDINGNPIDADNLYLDINLPSEGRFKAKIAWESSNTNVITNTGKVILPVSDTQVTLTATISSGSAKDTKSFPVTVSPRILETKANSLFISYQSSPDKAINDLSQVNDDLYLVKELDNAIKVSWTSNNTSIISNDGKVIIPKKADTTVKLTAILSKGNASYSKVFELTVTSDPEKISDEKAVESAIAYLDIDEDDFEDITDDLDLPYEGEFDTTIRWESSNLAIVSNDGKVKRPSKDTDFTMTAYISRGSVTKEVSFDGSVKGEGGSSSGGGGNKKTSKTSYSFTPSVPSYVPTTTPTPVQDTVVSVTYGFTDIADVQWAIESINALYSKGVISGVEPNVFAPNNNVTRAQFVQMLVKAFGFTAEDAVANFSDVSTDAWYYNSVAIASKLGIVSGYEDGTFGADNEITRQEMAVMAYRAAQVAQVAFKTVNEPVQFADQDEIASYALEAVSTMQQAGILNGLDGQLFAPNANATRAQAAKIVYGLITQ
mgnify:FL=1